MLGVFAVLALLFFTPSSETCTSIQALIGGELVAWDSASYSWPDLPDDLEHIGRIDFADGGIWEDYSKSEQARYLWVFVNYIVDGEPRGAHNFCGPYRIREEG